MTKFTQDIKKILDKLLSQIMKESPVKCAINVVICTNIIMVHYTRILQTSRRTVHNWENIHVNLVYAYSMNYYAMVRTTAKIHQIKRRQWNFAKVCFFINFSVFEYIQNRCVFVTTNFVAFFIFFPCSLTVFHRGRQQKSGGRQ